jgi:hypothetical protein
MSLISEETVITFNSEKIAFSYLLEDEMISSITEEEGIS